MLKDACGREKYNSIKYQLEIAITQTLKYMKWLQNIDEKIIYLLIQISNIVLLSL